MQLTKLHVKNCNLLYVYARSTESFVDEGKYNFCYYAVIEILKKKF